MFSTFLINSDLTKGFVCVLNEHSTLSSFTFTVFDIFLKFFSLPFDKYLLFSNPNGIGDIDLLESITKFDANQCTNLSSKYFSSLMPISISELWVINIYFFLTFFGFKVPVSSKM